MWLIAYYITQIVVSCLYILSFLCAIIVTPKLSPANHLRSFFWYPLAGCIMTILYWSKFFNLIPFGTYIITNKISLLYHYSFLSYFLYKGVNKKKSFGYIAILFLLIIIPFVYWDIVCKTVFGFAIVNGSLFILCCYYFFNLFVSPPVLHLNKEAVFWVSCGILLGAGMLIPFFLASLSSLQITSTSVGYLFGICAILGYGIMHTFFIKAYLCCLPQNS